jgi:hypothetical protein
VAQKQPHGLVITRMGFEVEKSAYMAEEMGIHGQTGALLDAALNLVGQLRGSFCSALSRRKQVAGAISHKKGPEFFQVKLKKAEDVRRELELQRVLIFYLSGRND